MIGAGYVGLVSGACFAEFDYKVTCIDKDTSKIEQIINGKIPIYENQLEELVHKNIETGNLRFSTNLQETIPSSDLIFIAVGTPTRRGDGHADLKYVYAAAEEISKYLDGYTVIVDKSTVPVGTAREVKRIIKKNNPHADFDVVSNPEFLREGSAIKDFMHPDRIVLGIEGKRAEILLKKLYQPLNLNESSLLITNLESAELIKYASNAFLATKISFINEMSLLCEKTNADINSVAEGMGLDNRIGHKFLKTGPGFGGSCFPKDTLALIRSAQEYGVTSRIIEAVMEVNASQKARMVAKIREAFRGSEADKRIAILGLTFKPETDDMRESPSLSIIPPLIDKRAQIIAYDPVGIKEAKNLLPDDVKYGSSAIETVKNADMVVLMTEWNQYREMNLKEIKKKMKGDIFVDLRNIFEPSMMKSIGFDYYSIGR